MTDSPIATLARAIRDKRIVPPMPEGRRQLGDKDLTDAVLVESDVGTAASFVMEYADRAGTVTERVVTLQAFEGGSDLHSFVAYCHMRGDYRRFLPESIIRMYSLDGTALDPRSHLGGLYELAAEAEEDNRLAWVMWIVMFVGRVDGEFHHLERQEVTQILGKFLMEFDCGPFGDRVRETHEIDPKLADMVFSLAPSGKHVLHAIERLRNEPDFAALSDFLIEALDRIVDADGRQDGEELIWFSDLVEALQP